MNRLSSFLCCLICLSATLAFADQELELLGVGTVPGSARDKSGLNTAIESPDDDQLSHDMLGGFSATVYSGQGNEFFYLSDRGPKDGAVDYKCRFHRFRLNMKPAVVTQVKNSPASKTNRIELELLETVLVKDKRGIPFTGLASAYQPTATQTMRLDPEGMRVKPGGGFYISDEYGPRLIEFAPDGTEVREFTMPSSLLISNPGLTKKDENPKNKTGRSTNRGMEGLAFSNDKKHLFGLMQSSLLQDSSRKKPAKPVGLHCRLEQFSTSGTRVKEMVYRMDSKSYKLNEILNCGPNKFIVIERDGEPGSDARFKKLMLVDTQNASDVSQVESLSPTDLPESIKPVAKKVLIDLLDPKWNLAGPNMPEKIEGLAFGPDLEDGRKLLVVTSDNDFEKDQPSYTFVFAVPKKMFE